MIFKRSIIVEGDKMHVVVKQIRRFTTTIDEFMNDEAVPVISIYLSIGDRCIGYGQSMVLIRSFAKPDGFAFENDRCDHQFADWAQAFVPSEKMIN